jgi:hypothetical protein
LSFIVPARARAGVEAVLASIPTGRFPRELRVIDYGRTLVVTNSLSKTVEFVDLDRVARVWPKR